MAGDPTQGEGVLTIRVWHEADGEFRARILRPGADPSRPDSLVVSRPTEVLAVVSDWIDRLKTDRTLSRP